MTTTLTTDSGCPVHGTAGAAAARGAAGVKRAARATHAPSAGWVTPQGAAWLASASAYPRSTLALWQGQPESPAVLPCGTVFDIVNVPVVFGRRMLGLLWGEGPGSGPVAVHRGRMLLFAAPGTAQRLPSLLDWLGDPPTKSGGEWGDAVPAPLCHGRGDAVTVPALTPGPGPSRWLVAPDGPPSWLPGAEALLWACMRAARATTSPDPTADLQVSIFPTADRDAKVYDVSRRR